MDTGSFIVHVKTDDIYKSIEEDVDKRFDSSNSELKKPLSKKQNNNVIGVMKDELGEKLMQELVGLKAKTYSYLIDDVVKIKKHTIQKRVS